MRPEAADQRVVGGAHAGESGIALLDPLGVGGARQAGEPETERQLAARCGGETSFGADGFNLLVDGSERGGEVGVEIAASALGVGERSPVSVAESGAATRRAAISAENKSASRPQFDFPPAILKAGGTPAPGRRAG